MEAVVLKMHCCRVIPYSNRKSYAASTQKEAVHKGLSHLERASFLRCFKVVCLSNNSPGFLNVFQSFSLHAGFFSSPLIFSPAPVAEHF